MTKAESWAQDQTHMKLLKPYYTIVLVQITLNYTTDQYIHTNIKLFTQQEFLRVPISICVVGSVNNVSQIVWLPLFTPV
jgi:hypothetical protein